MRCLHTVFPDKNVAPASAVPEVEEKKHVTVLKAKGHRGDKVEGAVLSARAGDKERTEKAVENKKGSETRRPIRGGGEVTVRGGGDCGGGDRGVAHLARPWYRSVRGR